MIKSFKYRLYPNKATEEKLQWTLDRCRELYNAALQERKEAWKYAKKPVSHFAQCHSIVDIKATVREEYQEIGAHVLYDVLKRVDSAFQAFYRRCKHGDIPGYPRFQGKNRYDSFTYPDTKGLKVKEKHVTLSKIGDVKVKFHRLLQGKIKTCTIKREGKHWYVIFACEVERQTLPLSYEDVGIDLGITHLAALSDGTFIDNPRHYRKAEKKLAALQQSLERKKCGSNRRKKAVQTVGKAHRKVRNQRADFLHKESRKLVNKYQVIVFEDLQTANLVKRPKPKQDEETGQYLPNGAAAKSGLNKSISDAGWNMFVGMVQSKAEDAGRTVLQVNPKYTSQICSSCGTVRKKTLDERWHSCECGCELDRDHNAAINILRLGSSLQSAMAVKPLLR